MAKGVLLRKLLFSNSILLVGFIGGFLVHNNQRCSWEDTAEVRTLVTYLVGPYFTLHVLTWYIVYIFLYYFVIRVGFQFLISFILSRRYEPFVLFLIELAFGYWTASEITGGWCDLESMKDCIQNPDGPCQSWFLTKMARMVHRGCEYFTYDYDEEVDAYYRRSDSPSKCVYIFRFMGHFIMTFLSSLFTILLMFF